VTPYRFRALSAGALLVLLAFAVMAFGAVDLWALAVFQIGVFLLAALWTFRLALGAARPVWNPFLLPLGLVTAWTGLQFAVGLSVYRYRTGAEALKWLALWLFFAVASQVTVDASIRRGLGRALLWFLLAVSVFGLIQNLTSAGMLYWSIRSPGGRIFGPFVNANHFAALLELVIPTAALLAVRDAEQRLLYAGVLMILLGAVVVCASRMGIVLAALETAVVLCFPALRTRQLGDTRSRRLWIVTATVAVALLLGLTFTNRSVAARFQDEQPYEVRWTVAQTTWKLFLARPWTGFGAGTFQLVYPSANPIDTGVFWSHAHNDPLQFAMELGVIGPVTLVWILWLLFRGNWSQVQWLRAVLPAVAVMVHSWVDFPLQIPAVAAAWLLVLAMLPAAGEPKSVPSGTSSAASFVAGPNPQ
jgi:O-antigen ligase